MLTKDHLLWDEYYSQKQTPKTEGEFIFRLIELIKKMNRDPNKFRLKYRDPVARKKIESFSRKGGKRSQIYH